jgi:tetratricopeptide (TPR) repeat protein
MTDILGLAFLLFIVAGVLLSYCVFRAEEIRDTRWFVPVALGCTVSGELTAVLLASTIAPSILALVPMLFMTFAYASVLAHCCTHAIFRLNSILMSDDALVVRKRWWAAETAKRRKDFQKAAAIYKEESDENPRDVETRRRLAEVLVELKRFDDAIGELEEGISLCQEDDSGSSLMLRIADIIERDLGEKERSVRVLRDLVERYPNSYYAKFARERLQRMSKE